MVSIIVPIYNAEQYLRECLLSIKAQTYTDFEVICIDDGSKDNSATICKEIVDNDCRFKLYKQNNAGVSVARNNALTKTTGEYVVFIDSDDIVEKHFLENLLELSKTGDFVITSYARNLERITSKGVNIVRYDVKSFIIHILNETIEHPNICMMLFKNSIIQEKKLSFTEGCVRNEDTEFYMKYLVNEQFVIVSDYKGYYYRVNENSAVHKFNKKSLTFIEADQRITALLLKERVIDENNLIVPASVQYFIYKTAKQSNKELYDYIHTLYDVKTMMKKMVKHPRISRKGIALLYSLLGSKGFYNLLSVAFKML